MVSMSTTREESSNTSPWALTMLTVVKELMNMAEPTGVPVAYNASSSAKKTLIQVQVQLQDMLEELEG